MPDTLTPDEEFRKELPEIRKHRARLAEFRALGIKTRGSNGVRGSVVLYASDADKVLKRLQKLERLEKKSAD